MVVILQYKLSIFSRLWLTYIYLLILVKINVEDQLVVPNYFLHDEQEKHFFLLSLDAYCPLLGYRKFLFIFCLMETKC